MLTKQYTGTGRILSHRMAPLSRPILREKRFFPIPHIFPKPGHSSESTLLHSLHKNAHQPQHLRTQNITNLSSKFRAKTTLFFATLNFTSWSSTPNRCLPMKTLQFYVYTTISFLNAKYSSSHPNIFSHQHGPGAVLPHQWRRACQCACHSASTPNCTRPFYRWTLPSTPSSVFLQSYTPVKSQ